MRISDWSSDVCSSDLRPDRRFGGFHRWLLVAALRRRHLADNTTALQHLEAALLRGIVRAFQRRHAEKAELHGTDGRSEERRVGKEGVSTCRTRGAPDH